VNERIHPAGLERFDRDVLVALRRSSFLPVLYGLMALSGLGERPVPLGELATALGRAKEDTERLVRLHTTARVRDSLVHWEALVPVTRARRTLHVGDRAVPMNRCFAAAFLLASILDVPFGLDEPCAATGVPIRIDFVPGGCALVEPRGTVVAVPSPASPRRDRWHDAEWKDDNVCVHGVGFASAAVARPWLVDHPGGRIFTVAEMFDRPWIARGQHTLRLRLPARSERS
jgi:hypothetical protein